ncbi:MAG: DNA replication and repair protein RecF [Candidatus Saccharibacteria bacterium]
MISDLRLQSFRSYDNSAFEFSPGVNIIVGPNASGKTNLLEAVLVISRGSSYRGHDTDLISYDKPWTRIESDTAEGKRIVTLEQTATKIEKKYTINGVVYRRLSLPKTVPVVVFEPDHLRLLSGGPERRRDYLDTLLEQTTPGFGVLRREYKRTLAQRNKLLKNPYRSQDEMFVWDIRLSELAGKIVGHRVAMIATMQEQIQELYQELSRTQKTVTLEYVSSCSVAHYSSDMLRKLEQGLEDDVLRGFTTNGPHRDDLAVILDDHPASTSASRGESRTLLLALKILELQLLESARNKKPILLLDDVFSELDGARRKALTSHLKNYQTFITTTDADIVVKHFMDNCQIIPTSS